MTHALKLHGFKFSHVEFTPTKKKMTRHTSLQLPKIIPAPRAHRAQTIEGIPLIRLTHFQPAFRIFNQMFSKNRYKNRHTPPITIEVVYLQKNFFRQYDFLRKQRMLHQMVSYGMFKYAASPTRQYGKN